MNRLLAIETAVNVCSVCIADEYEILSLREDTGINNHTEKLAIFIDEVMKESKTSYKFLSSVAVSGGPGSYTGLRIGVSAAKGLCYGLGIPFIVVPTLAAMAYMMKKKTETTGRKKILFQPMIDARRMEVYTAIYDENLNIVKETTADVIDEKYFDKLQTEVKVIIGGNGTVKLIQMFDSDVRVEILTENIHSSESIAALACMKYKTGDFNDVAYFEPFYLKDFIPGKVKVKGLFNNLK